MIRVLNFGGGTDSAALAVECLNRGIKIHIMPFADTGVEFPHTYQFVDIFSEWSMARGGPPVSVVKWIRQKKPHKGQFIPLDEWCFAHRTAPSRLFGYSGCTVKWKQQPVDKWLRAHPLIQKEHKEGRKVERLIGYDADETQRAKKMLANPPQTQWWTWRAPLVEWGLTRADCKRIIAEAGLPQPGKSSCWMCPSLKKREVLELARTYPDLARQAILLERQAVLKDRTGLGSHFSWETYLRQQGALPPGLLSM